MGECTNPTYPLCCQGSEHLEKWALGDCFPSNSKNCWEVKCGQTLIVNSAGIQTRNTTVDGKQRRI